MPKFDNPVRAPAVLRPDDAMAFIGVGRSRFYDLTKEPGFPKPVWLGERARGYLADDLTAWAKHRRDNPPAGK